MFPTFWSNIERSIQLGHVRAVDEVDVELSKRDDMTRAWARSQADLFVPLDEDVQAGTMRVLEAHPKLAAEGGSRNRANPFVIGLVALRLLAPTGSQLGGQGGGAVRVGLPAWRRLA